MRRDLRKVGYKENLIVDKPLVIISKEGKPADTVIQAADSEKDIFHVTADNVTIRGFNITGAQSKAGIYYMGSDGNITGNTLVYNEYGVFLKDSRNITIGNNTVFRNGFGVYLNNSSRNALENNGVNNSSHYGIYLENSNNNWLKNNNISNIEVEVDKNGIQLEGSDNNKLINNSISNNWRGIYLINSSYNELNKNRVSANYFSISLLYSDNNKLLDNTIELNKYTFSINLGDSHNNIIKGNNVGLNKETEGMNEEIKVVYNHGSRNNTIEGEQYTDNGQGTGGVFRVK